MKLAKSSVGFEHPAKGPNHCGQCKHFEAPDSCRIVAGMIEGPDWCKRFRDKREAKRQKAAAHLDSISRSTGKYGIEHPKPGRPARPRTA